MDNQIPQELDWVQARHECSLAAEFVALRMDAQQNVDQINSLRSSERMLFSLKVVNDTRFAVVRDMAPPPGSPQTSRVDAVVFARHPNHIVVGKDPGALMFEIRVDINDNGKCMMKVGNESLYRWQVLHRALKPLFFDIPD